MRSLRITAVVMAIMAIGILGYDYCDGHSDSGLFDTEFCPYCASYMSTELTPEFSFDRLPHVKDIFSFDFFISDGSYHSMPLVHHVTRRGPPVPPVFMQ